jgi:hypothetical protein
MSAADLQARVSKARAGLERDGVESLARLIAIGNRDSGQCRHVRAFLIGLYNGQVFPFDMTCMRAVDSAIANDMLAVLAMDVHTCTVEVHQRIPGVSNVIADWAAEVWPRQ